MPSFQVTYHASKDVKEVFLILDQILSSGKELDKFDPSALWKKKENFKGEIKGKQFQAQVTVSAIDGGGSKILFDIHVPLLLLPLKGTITQVLIKKLEKYIAA